MYSFFLLVHPSTICHDSTRFGSCTNMQECPTLGPGFHPAQAIPVLISSISTCRSPNPLKSRKTPDPDIYLCMHARQTLDAKTY
jgi:hypothetical protein